MDKKQQVEKLTNYMANFVDYIGKVLPDNEKEPGTGKGTEPSKLSGYRCVTVLGKMRNQLPADR